jgi:DNA invertase Pin-like site-specific DNA recombinase
MKTKAFSYIRFSSLEQRKGNSLKRQVERREEYVSRKGLVLDTTLRLVDAGRSGFHGTNRTKGALGGFLRACEEGRVPRGSFLLVENLDRLTREEISEALNLFLDIVNHGVVIVTLEPEREYRKETLDLTGLVLAIVELGRGHSESARKSELARDNWARRREQILRQVFMNKPPGWLRLNDDGKWGKLPDKVATVRRIFALAGSGHGVYAIAGILNKEAVPTLSGKGRWYEGQISKVLHNRSVLGEYQPRMLRDGKYVEVGSPVKGYFPRIVSDDVYQAAATATAGRRRIGGRHDGRVSNLFTGLVYDESGRSMCHRENRYLRASSPKEGESGPTCLRYEYFEKAVLSWLPEVRFTVGAKSEFDTLGERKNDLELRIKKLEARIRTDRNLDSLLDTLSSLKAEHRQVCQDFEAAIQPAQATVLHTAGLIRKLATVTGEERQTVRLELRQQIRAIVQRIDVTTDAKKHSKHRRYFLTVTLRDGHARRIYFDTARGGLAAVGVWGESGQGVPAADLAHQLVIAAEEMGDEQTAETFRHLRKRHTVNA